MINDLNDTNKSVVDNIEKAKEVQTYTSYEVEQKQRILKYISNDIINSINHLIYQLSPEILYSAWKYVHDKNKNDKDKTSYDYVNNYISNTFFKNKGKLLDIVACCGSYDGDAYAYRIEYEYLNTKFSIAYPCPRKILLSNQIIETDYGKIVLNYERIPSCWNYLGSSYNPEMITTMIEKFFEPIPV